MKNFFDDEVLLNNDAAVTLYKEVKDLPIIDYHCHLDESKIKSDATFKDIGELWLAGDHYKWRAMRLNGIDEYYITGKATYKEKFMKYASIVPKLIGNALYYWTHFELKQVFGVCKPLNKDTAEEIYNECNEKLKDLSVRKLLKLFNVEFVATTDDPVFTLSNHGKIDNTLVTPTFRPDKLYLLDKDYLKQLGEVAGVEIKDTTSFKEAITKRLDFFVSKGCLITDHGFFDFPAVYGTDEEVNAILAKDEVTDVDKAKWMGWLLKFLMPEYKKRNMVVQLHVAVTRNINKKAYEAIGGDSGFDVIGKEINTTNLINFLNQFDDENRPTMILYTLNANTVPQMSCITGAFRNVLMGAAWWFNDTLLGIKQNLEMVAEYASLGNNLGMLTDSRSFSSYSRFDFFRRILCTYVGEKVELGEYPLEAAKQLVKDISYNNIKNLLKL